MIWLPLLQSWIDHPNLQITILNVGQGDAILIKTPDNKYGLIDGGAGDAVLGELAQALPFGVKHLNFILATHPDNDHIQGLVTALQHYDVNVVFWQKHNKQSGVYSELGDRIDNQELANYELREWHDFRLGCCVVFDVVWPQQNQDIYSVEEANHISTAVILRYKNLQMYLGGDLGVEGELTSVSSLDDFAASAIDILKVGHHGSKTSSSAEFIQQIGPEMAVISVGEENSYGHPAPEVIDTLILSGADVWRTDQDGRITITSDGYTAEISASNRVEKMLITL